ncbi:MAG: hypothetical protein CMI12_01080 [Oceanospirillum sp.]|nr:hypothetical protein [Oceanospirillum sp.]
MAARSKFANTFAEYKIKIPKPVLSTKSGKDFLNIKKKHCSILQSQWAGEYFYFEVIIRAGRLITG